MLAFLVALTALAPRVAAQDCSVPAPAAGDAYAAWFSLEYKDTYKVATVKSPTGGADLRYVLHRKGCDAPQVDFVPDAVIATPVERVALSSSTFIPHLESAGGRAALVALNGVYTPSPCVNKLVDSGAASDCGWPKWTANATAEPCLTDAAPQVSFVDEYNTDAPNPVLFLDTRETSIMGRLDWYRFMAAFFDAEASVAPLLSGVKGRWACHAEVTASVADKPKAIFAYLDTWATPPKWIVKRCQAGTGLPQAPQGDHEPNQQFCQLLATAGADISLMTTGICSEGCTAAELAAAYADADLIINDFAILTWAEYKSLLNGTKAVQMEQVYDIWGSVDTSSLKLPAWNAQKDLEPDVALRDIILTAHPGLIGGNRVWLRNVAKEPVPEASTVSEAAAECMDVASPYAPINTGCPVVAPLKNEESAGSHLHPTMLGAVLVFASALMLLGR